VAGSADGRGRRNLRRRCSGAVDGVSAANGAPGAGAAALKKLCRGRRLRWKENANRSSPHPGPPGFFPLWGFGAKGQTKTPAPWRRRRRPPQRRALAFAEAGRTPRRGGRPKANMGAKPQCRAALRRSRHRRRWPDAPLLAGGIAGGRSGGEIRSSLRETPFAIGP